MEHLATTLAKKHCVIWPALAAAAQYFSLWLFLSGMCVRTGSIYYNFVADSVTTKVSEHNYWSPPPSYFEPIIINVVAVAVDVFKGFLSMECKIAFEKARAQRNNYPCA